MKSIYYKIFAVVCFFSLAAFSLAIAAADDPYDIVLEDGGESLVAQGAFSWVPVGKTSYANSYSPDYKFFLAGADFTRNTGTYSLGEGAGVGFKLIGGKTYNISVSYNGLNSTGGFNRGIKIVRSPLFSTTTSPIATMDGHPSSGSEVMTGTISVAPLNDATYWVMGLSRGNTTLRSITVTEVPQETFTARFSKWTAPESTAESATLTDGQLFFNNYLKNNGSDKTSATSTTIWTGNVTYQTYDLSSSSDYFSFTVGPGSGQIRVFSKPADSSTTAILSGDDYDSATPLTTTQSTGGEDTQIYTYNFNQTKMTQYFINGGMVGAIEVSLDFDPSRLTPITEDFVWYSLGKVLYNDIRADDRLGIQFPNGASLAPSNRSYNLYVNGSNTKTVDSGTGKNANLVSTDDAIVFRLAANTNYRIQIFADTHDTGILKIADQAYNYSRASAVAITDSNVKKYYQKMHYLNNDNITQLGNDNNTYILTYDLTTGNQEEVYWIDYGSNINVAGIQIFPWGTPLAIDSSTRGFTANTIWTVEDAAVTGAEVETSRGVEVKSLVSGSTENNIYFYGPSAVINDLTVTANSTALKTILLNRGNALGMKLYKGSKITINYYAEAGSKLDIVRSNKGNYDANNSHFVHQVEAAAAGAQTLQYTITETDSYWIRVNGGSSNYVYIPGFYIEVPDGIMQTITDDYLFTAGKNSSGTINGGTSYDEKRIKYIGTTAVTASIPSVNVPTAAGATTSTTNNTYTITTSDEDYLGFKIVKGRKGKIKVYYQQPSSNDANLFDQGSGYSGNGTSNGSTTAPQITFNVDPDNDEETDTYADHQWGWYWNADDGKDLSAFNGVEVTVGASPVQLRLIAQDIYGNNIISDICTPGGTTLSLDFNQGTFDNSHVRQIYIYAYDSGTINISSATLFAARDATLYTGSDEAEPTEGANKVVTRIYNTTFGTGSTQSTVLVHTFNHQGADDDVLYWLLGDINVAAIEVVFDPDIIEPATSRGENGLIYFNHKEANKTFPYAPREGVENIDHINKDHLLLKQGSTNTMAVMLGTTKVKIYRNSAFQFGGMKFDTQSEGGNQGGFLDNIRTTYYVNHYASANKNTEYKDNGELVTYEINANPQTECNGGIGGANTENGGLWLHPVSGDFVRLEPEYDGVVTMWIQQNGNTDGSTDTNGKLTRRPSYVMDENGYIMRRSTIKPSFEYSYTPSHYAIDGTWLDINPDAIIRDDYSKAWAAAMGLWNGDWSGSNAEMRYKETMRLYDFWYDGGLYTFDHPGELIALDDWNVAETGDNNTNTVNNTTLLTKADNPTLDDYQVTTVLNQNQTIGLPIYTSDAFYNLEVKNKLVANGNLNAFAKYGYEVPVHIHVRYVFPVRAGKSYYIGGRGTKNGFMAVKFEPMPANYDNTDYINNLHNYTVSDGQTTGKYILTQIADANNGTKTFNKDDIDTYIASYSSIPTVTIDPASEDDFSWAQDGKTVNVKLKRTFEADKWYPIVLPFSVSESKLRKMFGADVKVLYLDPFNHTMGKKNGFLSAINPAVKEGDLKLRFTRHYYQMLYANVPAFICPSSTPAVDSDGYLTFTNVHIEKTNLYNASSIGYKIGEATNCEYWVVGSYSKTTTGSDVYYMDNVGDQAQVYHSGSAISMKGTRCWIEARTKTNALLPPPVLREIGFTSFDDDFFDDDALETGIEDIVMDDAVIDMYRDENVYDLMGRIVGHGSLEGLRSGIYIFQGKKIYIR